MQGHGGNKPFHFSIKKKCILIICIFLNECNCTSLCPLFDCLEKQNHLQFCISLLRLDYDIGKVICYIYECKIRNMIDNDSQIDVFYKFTTNFYWENWYEERTLDIVIHPNVFQFCKDNSLDSLKMTQIMIAQALGYKMVCLQVIFLILWEY